MAQYKYSEIISWTKNKSQFVDEYLSGIDIQKIKCIKFYDMEADEAHKIIKRLKDKKYTKKLTNLQIIVVGNCNFSKKVAVDFCKLISAIPSITELIWNGGFEKTSDSADLYKGLLKIPFLKQISIGDGVRTKEDIKLIQSSTADINITHRRNQNMDTATEQFSSILRMSSTIRSLELFSGHVVANNYFLPAIGINTSLTRLFIKLDGPGYDFSALKPLTLLDTSNNLQDLAIDGRYCINEESMDTIYDIINNHTKLKKLSLRRINDFQKQLGYVLAKNTSLKSLTLADLDITKNLLEGFKWNTSLTEISISSASYLSICQSFVDAPNRSLKSLSLIRAYKYVYASNRIMESPTSLNQLLKKVSLTKLDLNGVVDLNVDLLVDGLNSANNNIRVLKIQSQALKKDMIVPLMRGLEKNSKIQQLDLSDNIIIGDEYRPIWNILLKNKTIRSLRIPDSYRSREAGVNEQMFSELMQVLSINTTLLFLEIWPREKDRVLLAELFDNFVEKNSALISLWSFEPLSENYKIELILRNNNRRYMDHIVMYHNLKRYNGTSVPLELWEQIFSHLILL